MVASSRYLVPLIALTTDNHVWLSIWNGASWGEATDLVQTKSAGSIFTTGKAIASRASQTMRLLCTVRTLSLQSGTVPHLDAG